MSQIVAGIPAEVAEHKAAQEQSRVLSEMLGRSSTDQEFRGLMLRDARTAFAEYGVQLPEAYDVAFIENQFDATIVLPDAIDDLVELEEHELLALNGGSPGTILGSIAITTSSSFCVSLAISVISVTVIIKEVN
jgi:hypothetical protein